METAECHLQQIPTETQSACRDVADSLQSWPFPARHGRSAVSTLPQFLLSCRVGSVGVPLLSLNFETE